MSLFHVYAPDAGVSCLVESTDPTDAEAQVREVYDYAAVTNVSEVPTAESCCDRNAVLLPRKQVAVEVVTEQPKRMVVEVVKSVPESSHVHEAQKEDEQSDLQDSEASADIADADDMTSDADTGQGDVAEQTEVSQEDD